MKTCSKCGVLKPESEFHKQWKRNGNHGLKSWCKPCAVANAAESQKRNADKVRVRKRLWARGHGKPRNSSEAKERWRQGNPEKAEAQWRARYAIKTGLLHKAPWCEECGTEGRLHMHHHLGYAPEHWLDVRWLCPACHSAEHVKRRDSERSAQRQLKPASLPPS